jgi:hypothetical protein
MMAIHLSSPPLPNAEVTAIYLIDEWKIIAGGGLVLTLPFEVRRKKQSFLFFWAEVNW